MNIAEWDGQILNGTVSGTANVRWGDNWTVDGVLTARNINAAVFAPALLSDGRGEGSGKFSMRGPSPASCGAAGRIDGSFTVSRGVLGSIDLSRAIQTGGKQATGRTQFNEMTGQGDLRPRRDRAAQRDHQRRPAQRRRERRHRARTARFPGASSPT